MLKCLVRSLLFFSFCLPLAGQVVMPSIFSDNMVLQQEKVLPVWGKAAPGETVTVEFAGSSVTAKADEKGFWKVELPRQQSSLRGRTLTVKGENTVVINNVLVGEVWLLGGQSNIEWPLERCKPAYDTVPFPKLPVRIFWVERVGSFEEQFDCKGRWEDLTPENAAKFSGIGFFFAAELSARYGEAVGLIGDYWGGSNAHTWVSVATLEKEFPFYADQLKKYRENLPAKLAYYEKRELPRYQRALEEFERTGKGQKPNRPRKPGPDRAIPAALFNAMIRPVAPYAIRGVLFYQGEANAHAPAEYEKLFAALIREWRTLWNDEFPFYFVQLAAYRPRTEKAIFSAWAFLRESQAKTLALPNTGMVSAVDIGEADNIHPLNKKEVARRLMTLERARRGEKVVSRPPAVESIRFADGAATVTFSRPVKLAEGKKEISAFQLAGADRKFVRAGAEFLSDRAVKVSSAEVKTPAALRYAWDDNPDVSLFGEEGLPVEPFRSDNSVDRPDRMLPIR